MFFQNNLQQKATLFSFPYLKKLLQTAIAYLFICDDAFLYPHEIQNSESQLHRVMKGSPPTAGREYGEEWAPCVKGVIFLLSEKTDFFFLLRKKIRKVLRIR